jgi:1-acyl-sn-glycerol-3-phosphate acyltransferase
LYGYIPLFRGSIDQTGLKTALSVLKQNGVIGIFPEGGIWDEGLKEAKIGVSWLSYKSGAPVIPVGFVGMKGALKTALPLKKPKIEMNIGELIRPQDIIPQYQSLKQGLTLVVCQS